MRVKVIIAILAFQLIYIGSNAQSFYRDLWQGNVEAVKTYIESNPNSVHEINQWGLTAIQTVTAWGHRNHTELIDLLMEKGANINQLSRDGKSVIHFAAESAPMDFIKYLIEKGADIAIIDGDNNSSLYYAILRQNNELIDLLYNETVELPVSGEKGRKLLQGSVSCGHKLIANKLISEGADMNALRGDGGTLLHCAAEGGLLEVMELLLSNKFDINAQNNYYYTPLHLATKNNNIDAVMLLIEKDANINCSTNIGLTPYQIAEKNEYTEISEILVKTGAKTDEFIFEVKGDYFGQKPPGNEPEIFAPGIVSTMQGFEFAGVFTPDNKEFFFTQRGHGFGQRIRYLKVVDGKWIEPDFAPFTYDCFEFEPGISPDGEEIYYGSMRPLEGNEELNRSADIWKVTRKEGWNNPKYIGGDMMYVNVSSNKTLYTTGRTEDFEGIIKREYKNGQFGEFLNLGDSINFMPGTAHPYIAPDESYLIFDAQPEEYGDNGALFISFKKSDGTWTTAKAFSEEINFGQVMTSWVSHDQKYLFFHRTVDGYGDIYWVDASIIEKLRKELLK